MILMTDTNTAYIVILTDLIHIAGHYYFTNRMPDYYNVTPTTNGPILTERKTPKTMVSSYAEAETCGTFENAQNIIPLQQIIKTVFLHIINPPKAH